MALLKKKNGVYVVEQYKPSQINDMYLDCDENNALEVDIKLLDKRHITDQQRKFIFALCNEISFNTGEDKEYIRLLMQQYNANIRGIEVESMATCDMTYANGLIDTIIGFCIDHDIPIDGDVIKDNKYNFNEKQVYMMCLKRICVVCGARADIHHVDHVGRGNNRNKISHIGKRVLPLCRVHHAEVHGFNMSEEKFITKYHLTPTVVDEKLEYFIKKGKVKVFKDDE
jgi:hypothetical protein